MIDDGPDASDGPSARRDRVTRFRDGFGAAVEVQHDEMARGLAEIVNPGNGFLTAVAPLVEVDGAVLGRPTDPVDLVRDGPFVGVQSEARPRRFDAQCLEGPTAGGLGAGIGQPGPPRCQLLTWTRRSKEFSVGHGMRRTNPPSAKA